ncbi:hypothetical protein AB1Y20_012837 [Prymnesium parvum]|uniref:RNA helicase n=1 Tax=Prymnesium parvum TaxID=97485 RepID=A0AB34IJZ4_PRYPA
MERPLLAFDKHFYYEHPDVRAWPDAAVASWRRAHRVALRDRRAPKPVRTFLEAAFPPFLTAPLEAAGFDRPTPVQSQAWPIILSGYDTIGLASTGSGKTLAFTLPALVHIVAQDYLAAGDGPIALMLAPTRELALQIKAECDKFGGASGVRNTCVYGGVPKGPQLRDLQHGVEIAIATPGRLLDFLDAGQTNLRRCTYLVLDEADRMLDLGFEPQLRQIIALIRADRQTLMFSATWPREVERLAREFMSDAVMVEVNNAADLTANENIEQLFEVCEEAEKHARFLRVLQSVYDGSSRVIIFCDTKRGCDALRAELRRRGMAADSLHGDKTQQERDWVLLQFKSGECPVLLATDVAARGLDVKDVRVVINYDAPAQAEDYVHRIGRAGRAGASGRAVTFVTPKDAPVARELVHMMIKSRAAPPPRDLVHLAQTAAGDAVSSRRWR